MADIQRVERNVRKMIGLNAPEADIDAYLQEEGHTPESFRSAIKGTLEPKPAPEPTTMESLGRGARNLTKAATALTGMFYDAAALPFNALKAGYNELSGERGGYIPPAR